MVPQSASVFQARTGFRHTSATEVNMWHFAPLNGDVFLYPFAQRPHVSPESHLERSLHSPRDKREERDEKLV